MLRQHRFGAAALLRVDDDCPHGFMPPWLQYTLYSCLHDFMTSDFVEVRVPTNHAVNLHSKGGLNLDSIEDVLPAPQP
jgi:hypothetical protein